MTTRVLVAVLVLSLGIQVNAQVSVKGRVTNESGESLPSAHISFYESITGVTSDSDGYFRISNIKKGDYTLIVSFVGYEKWVKELSLDKDEDLDIILKESSIMADEVIVRANRANVNDPVAYTNLDKNQLGRSDKTRDIPYLLEMTPSVVVTSDAGTGIGYTGLRIRGTDPSRINVSVNGIPYNDSESHDVYWVNMPDFVSSVENVQVQRGVGTSTQGAAAFGANINFQTKSVSSEPFAQIQSTVGSFNTWKNSVSASTGLINKHLSVDVRLSQLSSDGYIDRAFAKMKSYYLSAGWYGEKSIIRATTFSGKERTYQAWGGVPAELLDKDRTYNPYTYDNEVDDYLQTHYQIHWSYQIYRNLNVNAALHYTLGEGFYEQYKDDEDLEDYLLEPLIIGQETIYSSDLIRRKWLDNAFFGGIVNLNYTFGKMSITGGGGWNRYDGDHFGRVIWSEFASNSDIRHQYYFSNGLKTEMNYFTKINYQVLPKINLYTDLQLRHIDYTIDGNDDDLRDITQNHKYNFFNPKAGISMDLAGNHELYFSYSVGNREPKRSNFTDSRPGDEIKPEHLNDFEFGHSYRSSNVSLGINAYFMDYRDQLALTGEINDVGSAIMVNVPDSYRAGLEVMIAFQPFKRLKWEANATISRNRIKTFTEFVDDWDTWEQHSIVHENTSLAFSPEIVAGSRISWNPVTGLDLSLLSKYVGKQFIDNTSSDERMLNAYFVNNIRLAYEFKPKFISSMSLFIDVINILNERYESNAWVYSYFYEGNRNEMLGYYPQAGRHFMMGIIFDI